MKKKNKEKKVKQEDESLKGIPDIPDETKKKLEQIKGKIDTFKVRVLEKFEEYVLGIALLPPSKDDEKKEKINLLVLVLIIIFAMMGILLMLL